MKPLESLLAILHQQGAQTVVIEKNYIDKDYQDEFSAFYSRAFKNYTQRCTRLHFFSQAIPENTPPAKLANWSQSYLGFTVIRPTDLQKIGRTMLTPFIQDKHVEFVSCKANFTAHILGEPFSTMAMPFIQQDTQVGACAQASLWMLARYMSHRFGYREYLPSEINHLAKSSRALGRHYPAEWGLDLGQMLDALAGMGYSAVVYARQNINLCSPHINNVFRVNQSASKAKRQVQLFIQQTAKLADITYRYVESGLPVILCTATHALVAIGHTYNHSITARLAIERIPAFIVNDDAEGPYGRVAFAPNGNDDLSFAEITEIIVVVPPEVTLRGEEAESSASEHIFDFLKETYSENTTWRQALVEIRPEFNDWFDHLEFRTYLRASVEWQMDLRQWIKTDAKRAYAAKQLLALDYPKYIWVTEISSSPLLNRAERSERQCLGCVVVDSTAPARTRGTMAMLFADVLAVHDRQGKTKSKVEYIKDSTPFSHKIW